MNSDRLYVVEKILDKSVNPTKYLIKWKGYSKEESTWEPPENLRNIRDMIIQFENQLKTESSLQKCKSPKFKLRKKAVQTPKKEPTRNTARYKFVERDIDYRIFKKCFFKSEVPESVLKVEFINDVLYCLLNFKKRADGLVTPESYIETYKVAESFPVLLVNYYEKNIEFIDT